MVTSKSGIYVRASGRLGGPNYGDATEQWSTGFWLRTDGLFVAPTQAYVNTLAEESKTLWGDFISDATMHFTGSVWLDETNVYGYSGGSSASVIGYGVLATPVHGAEASNGIPFQNTIVASLEAAGRVKPKYGRMYLPPQRIFTQLNGLVNLNEVQPIADRVALLLASFAEDAAAIKPDGTISASGAAYPTIRPVITTTVAGRTPQKVATVRVGRVVDTQRRRRNALSEGYADTPLVITGP